MRWCVGPRTHALIDSQYYESQDGGNGRRFRKFDASSAGTGQAKIDGSMALLSGLRLMADHLVEAFDACAMIGALAMPAVLPLALQFGSAVASI